jgi:hypothetical protein
MSTNWRPYLRHRWNNLRQGGASGGLGEIDEVVGASAEQRKAFRNEGNSDEPTQSLLVNDFDVISNLDNIGISLGVDRSEY